MPFLIQAAIYIPLIAAAGANGLEPELVAAVCYQESGFNPDAVGDNGHSVGLMQLHDQGAGHGMSVIERRDPRTNLNVGSHYLKVMIERTGSIEDGLSAYNQGFTAWQRNGRTVNTGYVNSILAKYTRFKTEGLAPKDESDDSPRQPVEIQYINSFPVAFAFLKEYQRRGRYDGNPLGPAAYCGENCIQSFESGAVYVWTGGYVHVLGDSV